MGSRGTWRISWSTPPPLEHLPGSLLLPASAAHSGPPVPTGGLRRGVWGSEIVHRWSLRREMRWCSQSWPPGTQHGTRPPPPLARFSPEPLPVPTMPRTSCSAARPRLYVGAPTSDLPTSVPYRFQQRPPGGFSRHQTGGGPQGFSVLDTCPEPHC